MKIQEGVRVILGNREYVGEIPDKVLTPLLKKIYEKKFGVSKPKPEKADK